MIEINQGATFEKNNNNDDFNEQYILEKTNNILSNLIDSIGKKQENYTDLMKEIKFIDSNIDTAYIINNSLFYTNSTNQVITLILDPINSNQKNIIDRIKIIN